MVIEFASTAPVVIAPLLEYRYTDPAPGLAALIAAGVTSVPTVMLASE